MARGTGWFAQGSTRLHRRVRSEGAQSLVEMGIFLPVLLILIIGVVEVSAGYNAYTSVVSSARDGARLGSKGVATDTDIKNLVVRDLGRLPETSTVSDVTVTHTTVSSRNAVKVQACHNHNTFLRVPLLVPNPIRICSASTMPQLN